MLSIYQIKEGRDILNDLNAKSYRLEMLYYNNHCIHTDYGVDFYNGYGTKTDSIPVMMPANASHISSLASSISSDSVELTESDEVFAVTDNNILILFKEQRTEFNTIKAKMTNAKSALWYFNLGLYDSLTVKIPATVSSGSYKLYKYNGTSWTNTATVSVSSSEVTLNITATGYYYVGSEKGGPDIAVFF